MKKYILWIVLLLILGLGIDICFAQWMRAGNVELTIENEPEIEGIAIIKIKAMVYTDIPNEAINKARIYCGIPEGLEFINDKNYIVEPKYSVSGEWFNSVTLYEGPMKEREEKEISFKVRIPDTKRYIIFGGVTGSGDEKIEIDLGEPEPPEWKTGDKNKIRTKEEKQYIQTRLKQVDKRGISELNISEDSLPPLRTELKIRTKHKPYIDMPYNPQEIPLRYLIYTEEAAKEVEVTVELPAGLELINMQEYETSKVNGSTIFELFRGPMGFQECKAFYFKVRSDKEEQFIVKVETGVLTTDGREFFTEDYRNIELRRLRY